MRERCNATKGSPEYGGDRGPSVVGFMDGEIYAAMQPCLHIVGRLFLQFNPITSQGHYGMAI